MVKIGDINLGEFPLLLAPMEDVSDPPFRKICKENGADMLYTEFVSSEGLIRDAMKSKQKLDIFDYERPVGIQVFGGDIGAMRLTARIVEATQPEVLDINYGCPVKKVVKKGAGAGILKDIPQMVKLTRAVVRSTRLPVTVKTRLGWDDNTKNIEEVAERLQDEGIQALSIHGRTRVQMYKGQADWTLIEKVKNNPRIKIPIFGNGDIKSAEKALEYRHRYGVDGIMIGRGAIGNPWIFNDIKHYFKTGGHLPPPTLKEKVASCLQLLHHSLQWKGENLGILEMRRHYGPYLKGLSNIKPYRNKLVRSDSPQEIEDILHQLVEDKAKEMEVA